MKGIILAGGADTRLYPATLTLSKQLLPVFDKPMIYYLLCVLIHSSIRDILIISTPRDLPMFELILGDGSAFGIDLSYAAQAEPDGLPQAFLIGAAFLDGGPCALILGDNIFYGDGLVSKCRVAVAEAGRTAVFAYQVNDPEHDGVVTFDPETAEATAIDEKPAAPKSNWALTGLYFFERRVVDIVRSLVPSARGELEIADLLGSYLAAGELLVEKLGQGYAWLDIGTHDGLYDASSFVRTIERRQGIKVACLQEIAHNLGYLDSDALMARADLLGKTDYPSCLRRCALAA